jgi:hypothetical protein
MPTLRDKKGKKEESVRRQPLERAVNGNESPIES